MHGHDPTLTFVVIIGNILEEKTLIMQNDQQNSIAFYTNKECCF